MKGKIVAEKMRRMPLEARKEFRATTMQARIRRRESVGLREP